MINNYDDILNWIKENDIMILDRGFRDSLGVLKSLGIDVAMPSFLSPKQKQFDVQAANNSRFVTMLRWVVESVNARIKRFKWFNQVIPNSSVPCIQDFTAIIASLLKRAPMRPSRNRSTRQNLVFRFHILILFSII